jgi:hypothetical protein
MTTDYNLQFIRGKLSSISNALMYNMSVNSAKLPNDIVRFQEIDEHGRILFSIQSPKYNKHVIESSIPVRLFFYQKGLDYFIEASGLACMECEEYRDGIDEQPTIIFKMIPTYFQFEEFSKNRWLAGLEKWYLNVIERIRLYYLKKIKHYGYQA